LAAELKRGPAKIYAAGKIRGPNFFLNLTKKGRIGAELFEDDYSYKKLKISAEKYISSPDVFDFLFPLLREIVCNRQKY
jgi:hypothetical protein